MAREINLLPPKDVAQERLEALSRRLIIASAAVLIITASIIVAIFGYLGVLSKRGADLEKDFNSYVEVINSHAEVETYQRLVKANIGRLSQVLADRVDFSQVLAHLREVAVPGIAFTDLSMDTDGKLTISGIGSSSVHLAASLNNLLDPQKGGKYFTDVNIASLSGDKTGAYRFTISLLIIKDKLPVGDFK